MVRPGSDDESFDEGRFDAACCRRPEVSSTVRSDLLQSREASAAAFGVPFGVEGLSFGHNATREGGPAQQTSAYLSLDGHALSSGKRAAFSRCHGGQRYRSGRTAITALSPHIDAPVRFPRLYDREVAAEYLGRFQNVAPKWELSYWELLRLRRE